jgi:hypothetical protein
MFDLRGFVQGKHNSENAFAGVARAPASHAPPALTRYGYVTELQQASGIRLDFHRTA